MDQGGGCYLAVTRHRADPYHSPFLTNPAQFNHEPQIDDPLRFHRAIFHSDQKIRSTSQRPSMAILLGKELQRLAQ